MTFSIAVVSLFPDMFEAISQHGITARAISRDLLDLDLVNPRDFALDKHRTVDDRPYGGGPGMVGMVEPWREAIRAARLRMANKGLRNVKTVYLSPQGKKLDHDTIHQCSQEAGWILVAGRYEGLDERLLETEIDLEWSIGDYVLSGGELAAMVVIDSLTRHLPGALGHSESAVQDSFANGLLDYPHYTRPERVDGMAVPSVLMSGDHAEIAKWREAQSLGNTWLKKPELLEKLSLTDEQAELLRQFKCEYAK